MNVIVGIDPGTTVGWCALDLDGNIITIGSEKEVSIDSLIAKLRNLTPLAVGCDKAKVPHFVSDFAAKFHSRIISPKQDLSIMEKRDMTKNKSNMYSNAHEMDALASSLLAFRRLSNILTRIKSYLSSQNHLELFECVASLVIREELTIHASFMICTPDIKVENVIVDDSSTDKDYSRLYSLLKSSRKECAELRRLLDSVRKENQEAMSLLEKKDKQIESLVKPKSSSVSLNEKEKRIRILSDSIDQLKKSLRSRGKKLGHLEKLMLDSNCIAVPRLDRLSGVVPSSRILFVDNPNEFSESFLKSLPKDVVIIYNVTPGMKARKLLPICIASSGLIISEFKSIVILKKDELDRRRASSNVLKQVILKYKASRFGSI